jgi:glycosyltransferase involved in cell wall biosynthesis
MDAQRLAGDALAGIRAHDDQLGDLRRKVRRLERWAAIPVVTDWISRAEVPEDLLVSIVLPTRNRASVLPEAVRSVQEQVYGRWELLIVNDGSTDGTQEIIDGFADERIRSIEGEGRGVCRARNLALEAAKGDVIIYLDDDNWMEPLWLKAVAWAMSQRPDVNVLYGARIIDDFGRVHGLSTSAEPMLQFEPWDRETLEYGNFADGGVMAHRPTDKRWDENLQQMGDWGFFLQITDDETPLELPVIAIRYHTQADERLSETSTYDVDRARVIANTEARRTAR